MNKIDTQESFNRLITHLKSSGFVFQNSQIYGGLANSFDLGPLGSLFAKALKDLWIQEFVNYQSNVTLVDSKIILDSKVWEASGHLRQFHDLLIEEKFSNKRYRLDHLLEENFGPQKAKELMEVDSSSLLDFLNTNLKMLEKKPVFWSKISQFNLMFETSIGTQSDKRQTAYLRPETAQGVYINFKNIQRALRLKIPFGVAQIGKAFRNEITPGHFIFRTREFEQMELEYFCSPNQDKEAFEFWVNQSQLFLLKAGLNSSSIRQRAHPKEELAHYSSATTDIEFKFPFGWGELLGVANRGDFDLSQHQEKSQESLEYLDPQTHQKFIPYIVEASIGVERLMLALLWEAFREKNAQGEETILLSLSPLISPFQVAVLPLLKSHSKLATSLFERLKKTTNLRVGFDESGSIGKRYRRQDAIGTPFCITIDERSLNSHDCTIRFRDSMAQHSQRIPFDQLPNFLNNQIYSEHK